MVKWNIASPYVIKATKRAGMHITFSISPFSSISLTRSSPVAKMIALGGDEIGSINAYEEETAAAIVK